MLLLVCKIMLAQTSLSMQDALHTATDNYQSIKAKKIICKHQKPQNKQVNENIYQN